MEVLWFIYVAVSVGILSLWGAFWYRRGMKAKRHSIGIDNLDMIAGLLWFNVKEYYRHGKDRQDIRAELREIIRLYPQAVEKLPGKIQHDIWIVVK